VKSSHRQFNKADVVEHANALQESVVADEYELILLGPCSQAVVELGSVGKVRIPVPKNLDLQGLIEQAAHKLDKFYEARDYNFVSAQERELLTHHLVSRLEAYSSFSFRITRSFFEELLQEAVSRMYSQRKDKVDILEYYRLRINRNYDEMAERYHVSTTRLRDAIMTLSDRHRVVLTLRNGLRGEGEKLSNKGVALEFGLTAERIRELDRQAKVILKRRLAQQEKKGVGVQDQSTVTPK